ncbi:MAG: hypothetical protein ACHP79_00390, partial [Terriglobales bacterium]
MPGIIRTQEPKLNKNQDVRGRIPDLRGKARGLLRVEYRDLIAATLLNGEEMTHTLLPLSLGKLLDETFNIYRRNFLLFVGISAVPNLVVLLLQLVVTLPAAGDQKLETIGAVFGILGTLVVSMFAGSIVTAATTFGVSDIYLDRPTSMVACFSRVTA